MTKKIQLRINLLRYNRNAGVSSRSKSCHSKDSNTDTGEDNTPKGAEDNEDPVDAATEQDEREDGQVSPGKQATHKDSEDNNYLPLSEDEVSLSTEDFIVPEEPLEQEALQAPANSHCKEPEKEATTAPS